MGSFAFHNVTVPPLFDLFEVGDDGSASVTNAELAAARSKLGNLLDLLPAGLLIHQEQSIVYANFEAARMLERSGDSLVGRHFLDFLPLECLDTQRDYFRRCISGRELIRTKDCIMLGAEGARTPVQISMSPLPWEGLPVIYILLNDVSALKASEERLRLLSITDSLTGLFNRRHFIEESEREIARARRYQLPTGMLLLDIDHFKRINDTYGHTIGDEVLKAFAAACQKALRANDILGRLGGEEFGVFLPQTDADGAVRVAERLRCAVEAIRLPHDAKTHDSRATDTDSPAVSLTVSIGVAAGCGGEPGVDALLSRADEALYRAKAAGRNRVACADLPPP